MATKTSIKLPGPCPDDEDPRCLSNRHSDLFRAIEIYPCSQQATHPLHPTPTIRLASRRIWCALFLINMLRCSNAGKALAPPTKRPHDANECISLSLGSSRPRSRIPFAVSSGNSVRRTQAIKDRECTMLRAFSTFRRILQFIYTFRVENAWVPPPPRQFESGGLMPSATLQSTQIKKSFASIKPVFVKAQRVPHFKVRTMQARHPWQIAGFIIWREFLDDALRTPFPEMAIK